MNNYKNIDDEEDDEIPYCEICGNRLSYEEDANLSSGCYGSEIICDECSVKRSNK